MYFCFFFWGGVKEASFSNIYYVKNKEGRRSRACYWRVEPSLPPVSLNSRCCCVFLSLHCLSHRPKTFLASGISLPTTYLSTASWRCLGWLPSTSYCAAGTPTRGALRRTLTESAKYSDSRDDWESTRARSSRVDLETASRARGVINEGACLDSFDK